MGSTSILFRILQNQHLKLYITNLNSRLRGSEHRLVRPLSFLRIRQDELPISSELLLAFTNWTVSAFHCGSAFIASYLCSDSARSRGDRGAPLLHVHSTLDVSLFQLHDFFALKMKPCRFVWRKIGRFDHLIKLRIGRLNSVQNRNDFEGNSMCLSVKSKRIVGCVNIQMM